jgi:hypothetical protein
MGVTLYSLVDIYQRFGGNFRLHLQGIRINLLTNFKVMIFENLTSYSVVQVPVNMFHLSKKNAYTKFKLNLILEVSSTKLYDDSNFGQL